VPGNWGVHPDGEGFDLRFKRKRKNNETHVAVVIDRELFRLPDEVKNSGEAIG
jgi:hypothetical protein